VLECPCPPDQLLAKASALAKSGKLPGFASTGAQPPAFRFEAFGEPLDHEVRATLSTDGAGGARAVFAARMLPRTPAIFAIVAALSIWPGSWATDSMLRSYFDSYDWNTYAWYIPLTVLPLPFAWRRMARRSRASAFEHFREKFDALALATGGRAGA
jgi:hypothetical protein